VAGVAALALGAWAAAACGLDRYGRGREASGSWDAIVVAGARVHHGGHPSGSLDRRTRRAVELWHAGRAPILVTTGGPRLDVPAEARIAELLARSLGVPESAIVIEERSRSTDENARFSRELIGDKRVLVVTDAYHVWRTERLFRRQFSEVSVVGVTHAWYPQMELALREVLAVGWLLLSSPFH
jgi:uncharacterized SAM-binding protein YcdF (DUF218 family)